MLLRFHLRKLSGYECVSAESLFSSLVSPPRKSRMICWRSSIELMDLTPTTEVRSTSFLRLLGKSSCGSVARMLQMTWMPQSKSLVWKERLGVIEANAIILSTILMCTNLRSVSMQSVIMLNAIMLSVVASCVFVICKLFQQDESIFDQAKQKSGRAQISLLRQRQRKSKTDP